MVRDFPGTFPGAVLSGNASSPITVNYAGHVGVGMTVAVAMGNGGPQFRMNPAIIDPSTGLPQDPPFVPVVPRPRVGIPPYDPSAVNVVPPPFVGQGAVTAVSDSAGNVYHFAGAQSAPRYLSYPAFRSAVGWEMPIDPWYCGQTVDYWLAYCVLAHAVDASTVLSIGLSGAATFYVIGDGFAGATDIYGLNFVAAGGDMGWGIGYTNSFDVAADLSDVNPLGASTQYPFGSPAATGWLLSGTGGGRHFAPGNSGHLALNYVVGVQQGPASDHAKHDVSKAYSLVDAPPSLGPLVGSWHNAYDAEPPPMTAGGSVWLSLPDSETPTQFLPAAFTLTAHSVHADDTAQAGGKRLDMTFESNGAAYNAGNGWTAICLDGSPAAHKPIWTDNAPGAAPPLCPIQVNTPSGPQPWTAMLTWWRALIANPVLDDPAQTGPAQLADITLYYTTTQTPGLNQECDAPLLGIPLVQDVALVTYAGLLPDTSGLLTGGGSGSGATVLTGDVFIGGTLAATGASLESTVLGTEIGFRLWHQHRLPSFMQDWELVSLADSQWNTMTANVRVTVSLYFAAPYVDPVSPDDIWTQPDDGPGPDVSPGGGGPPPGGIASAITIGEPIGGLREGV